MAALFKTFSKLKLDDAASPPAPIAPPASPAALNASAPVAAKSLPTAPNSTPGIAAPPTTGNASAPPKAPAANAPSPANNSGAKAPVPLVLSVPDKPPISDIVCGNAASCVATISGVNPSVSDPAPVPAAPAVSKAPVPLVLSVPDKPPMSDIVCGNAASCVATISGVNPSVNDPAPIASPPAVAKAPASPAPSVPAVPIVSKAPVPPAPIAPNSVPGISAPPATGNASADPSAPAVSKAPVPPAPNAPVPANPNSPAVALSNAPAPSASGANAPAVAATAAAKAPAFKKS